MKDFWNDLTHPVSYTLELKKPFKKPSEDYFKPRELDRREKLLRIVNTTYNKKRIDGRIYGLSKKGEYTSHTVSPYSKNFLENIEENIKPLVISLMKKNYFSISSCEGHSIYFKRYVTVIFPSEETALRFKNKLPYKRLKFKLSHCTEVLNNPVEPDEYGNIINCEKKESKNSKESSVEYINYLIRRSYSDAWLLEVIISDQIEQEEGFKKYFKNWKEIIFKKLFINSFTRKLTQFVEKTLEPNIY
jgi:hypothetical protein